MECRGRAGGPAEGVEEVAGGQVMSKGHWAGSRGCDSDGAGAAAAGSDESGGGERWAVARGGPVAWPSVGIVLGRAG